MDRVLRYPKTQQRYKLRESDILAFLHLLTTAATIVPAEPSPLEGLPDPSDVKLFAAALGGRADYLVTGDRALLELGDYRRIRIIPAPIFVEIVAGPPVEERS